jgi:hypothetical protein
VFRLQQIPGHPGAHLPQTYEPHFHVFTPNVFS